MATTTVLYRLVGQDAGASRVMDHVGGSASKADRIFRSLAIGGAIVGEALVKAADDAVKFQSSMTKISTQAGGTARDVKVLSDAVLKLAPSTQQGPQKLSEALYHLKSVGMSNVAAMKSLKIASDLAAVGGSDLEATTNALAGAWRTGIRGATDMGAAAGSLNAIIGAGNMRMEDLVSAIGTGILPSAKTFGLSLTQVGAALALMTDEGVPAVDAATRLRMSFSLLGAPSAAAEKWLKKIGLSGIQLGTAMRGPGGIIAAITLLKKHLEASGLTAVQQSQVLSRAFGGGRSSSAILAMVNNLDVLRMKQEQINKSTGKYGAAVIAQRKTAEAQLHMLESSLQTASIRLGNAILPPLTKFAGWVNSTLLPTIGRVSDALEKMVPTARIKSGLDTAKRGLAGFFQSLTSSPKAAPVARVAAQNTAMRLQVPGFTATAAAGSALAATRLQLPAPGVGQTTAQRLQVPTGPHASRTTALPAPDVSGWARAGIVVRTALADTVRFLRPVGASLLSLRTVGAQVLPFVLGTVVSLARGFGRLLLPAVHIVGTFIMGTFVPVLRNVATLVMPLLGLLKPLAVVVGVALYAALAATGFVINSVVGPALVAVTGWMAHNRAVVAVLAGAVLLLNADLLITRAQGIASAVSGFVVLRAQAIAGAVGMQILNTWNKIVGLQMRASAIATRTAALAQRLWNSATVQGGLAAARSVVRYVATRVTMAASAVATGLATAAQWLWTAAVTAAAALANTFTLTNIRSRAVTVAGAVATGISTAATWLWNTSIVTSTVSALASTASWVARNIAMAASTTATFALTAATWLWNAALLPAIAGVWAMTAALLANPITWVVIGIMALIAAIVLIATKTTWFQTAWKATWGFIKTAAAAVFHFLTHGLGQLVLLLLGPIGVLLLLALHWRQVWGFIQDSGKAAWQFLDKWVIQPIATGFTWLWEKGIQPALRFIVNGFLDMVGMILKGADTMFGWIPGIGGKVKGAIKAFTSFRDGVNAALGGIKPKVVPVTVSFNGVPQGTITGHTYTSTTGFTYARGGKIPEWLGTPNVDSVPILAMGGEYVVNKKSTAKHRRLLEAINSGDPAKYAKGGMVGFTHAASSDMALANRIDIAKQVKAIASAYAHAFNASRPAAGLAWARSQVGMPYQWGGDGNPSWDCSGFQSAIESVMRGEKAHRRWATGAFSGTTAPPGWVLNAKSPFRIGVTNAGVGHTAGTLNGVNVEMSTVGGRVGGGARGADDPMFPAHYGLVGFDRGGIARGRGYMPKMTHAPERVLSPRQTAAFEQLVTHLTQGAGTAGTAAFTKLGAQIPAGVAAGVKANATAANAAMTDLGKGLQAAFATELQISSPSKKTRTLAAYTVFGLVQGLTGSTASVKAASKRIASALYVAFGSGHSALQATVARDNKALLSLAAHRDIAALKLKAANKTLVGLQKAWATEQKSVADSIMQSSSVVVDATNTNAVLSATDVLTSFTAQQQKALQFAKYLHQAQALGLNATMVQQIASAGVSGGFATAQALASASTGQVRQLNQMQKAMQSTADHVGGAVADSMYGAGIRTAQGLVAGLRSQEKAIDAEMLRIAVSMQKAIKHALGIHSPSTVAADIGVRFPQGLGVGIVRGIPHAVAAVMTMSSAVTAAGRRTGLATDSGVPVITRRGGAHGQAPSFEQMVSALSAAGGGSAGGEFTGDLYLDSGEFLGAVKGTVKPMIRASEQEQARRQKVGRR